MLQGYNLVALVLLGTAHSLVAAHSHGPMDMGQIQHNTTTTATPHKHLDQSFGLYDLPNYAGLNTYTGMIAAHIGLMSLAWFLVLPIGVMFSIAHSKLAVPVQFSFLLLNGLGVICGTIYNINTPDLYENNAHHKIGWVATWVVTAQAIMSLLLRYSGQRRTEEINTTERTAFLPQSLHRLNQPTHKHRWSGDSGQGTEPASSNSSSRTLSPSREYDYRKSEIEKPEDMEEIPVDPLRRRQSWFRDTKMDQILSKHIPRNISRTVVESAELGFETVTRLILILGFITLTSGIVTYTGIFRADNIFNGLAHWVKGGIFFWYGLLTLGRWLGSFADLGWAWNLKPTRSEVGWKSRIPSAEFVESFVIFLYGCTNVFMEHMAAWGGAWSPQDFEHVAISIMFFGGGLAGMLIESKSLRTWLNTNIDIISARSDVSADGMEDNKKEPASYTTSLNIIPALIIFLLGIMMSSHHQDSMVATMVHKQWGTLLSGFALFRGLTYLLTYLVPPKSIYPSRPPTELAASFCLIAGGLVLMMSTKDVIHYMEEYNLMAMFTLTVTIGFTALLMAYTMVVIGLKGWAIRREQTSLSRSSF